MLPAISGSTQQYLADLQRMNSELTEVTKQLSSGLRVTKVSDDPSAVAGIMRAQSQIDQLTQSKTNLNQVKSELESGDSALNQAMQNVESAISIASQSTASSVSPEARAELVTEVQGILDNLVKLSATSSNGRYIFSGDQDQQALYTLDATQPTGVRQLATANSTRSVTDVNGIQVWLSKTSSEIFDARNPDNSVANNNVFAAVHSLLTALQTNNNAGALASIDLLKNADAHLNQELGYYGIGQTGLTDAVEAADKSITSEQVSLGSLRDADPTTAAIELNQLTIQQQAALSAKAKVGGLNLFDFLA